MSAPIEAVSNKGLRKFPIAFEEQMHGKHVCDVLPFQDSKIESKAGKNRYYKKLCYMEGGDKHERQKREKEILPREREKEREKHGW